VPERKLHGARERERESRRKEGKKDRESIQVMEAAMLERK